MWMRSRMMVELLEMCKKKLSYILMLLAEANCLINSIFGIRWCFNIVSSLQVWIRGVIESTRVNTDQARLNLIKKT